MDSAARIMRWRAALDARWGVAAAPPRRTPIGQLVKSLISGRTRDEVSLEAYRELRRRFGNAAGIAAADPRSVEQAITYVTFADVKAERLVRTLRKVAEERPDFRLDFLRGLSTPDALAWLERLPGVGRKTATAVMNFSTIDRPVMVVDTHVMRVLSRLSLGSPNARALSERVTAAMPGWRSGDFLMFHIHLKRLGQTACKYDAPHCGRCPLVELCATGRDIAPRERRNRPEMSMIEARPKWWTEVER